MKQKIFVYKVSLNSPNIFSLRKTPEQVRNIVYENIIKKDKPTYTDRTLSYAIEILDKPDYFSENMILGRVINFRKNNEIEQWDDVQQKTLTKVDENFVIEKVHFVYEKFSELLVFEERSRIKAEKTVEVFKYVVNFNNIDISIDLNPILNKEEVKRRINKLKKITSIRFELIPNNPDQKLWKFFERMNERFASIKSVHSFENREGLNYTSELEQTIDDVNEGKSRSFFLTGYDIYNNYDEIRSDDFIKKFFKKVDSSVEGRIKGLWEIVKEILDI